MPLQPGMFFILPPGYAECYETHSAPFWSVRWLHFTGAVQPWLESVGLMPACVERVHDLAPFVSAHQSLLDLLEQNPDVESATVSSLLYRCLIELFTRIVPSGSSHHPVHTKRIQQALDYMHQHFASALTLEEVAAQTGLSPYHFSRLFTRSVGRSPMAYLSARRLAVAKTLLASQPDLSIHELSRQVGYPDASHFGKVFRTSTGFTPRQFRSMYRQGG